MSINFPTYPINQPVQYIEVPQMANYQAQAPVYQPMTAPIGYEQIIAYTPQMQPMTELDRKIFNGTRLSNGKSIALPITRDDCYFRISHTAQPNLYNIKRVHQFNTENPENLTSTVLHETYMAENALRDYLSGMQTFQRIDSNTFILDTFEGPKVMNHNECEQFLAENRLYIPAP